MAAGYGEGRVIIGTSQVGRVAVTGVAAVPALSPRIRFGLSWTLGHRVISQHGRAREEYRVVDFRGELRLGADDLLVGTLAREGPRRPLRSFDYVDTQDTSVALDLGGYRLERLEERRAGGALALTMRLWPRIEMGGATTSARVEEIHFQVPRDDWLAALRTLTGEQVDLLEIRYHLVYADGYPTSLAALRRARDAADRGDFDAAVLQARKAISLMGDGVKAVTGGDLKTALSDKTDKRHAQLYAGIVKCAKEMGNITAHRAEPREYTRVEAHFAIRLATITLEVVAGLLAD